MGLDAERFAEAARKHWGIENSLHWSLHVTFREGNDRVWRRRGAEILGLLRRLALSLLKGNSSKLSLARKRLAAALGPHFLEEIASRGCDLEKT